MLLCKRFSYYMLIRIWIIQSSIIQSLFPCTGASGQNINLCKLKEIVRSLNSIRRYPNRRILRYILSFFFLSKL
jgi:hypothetical protein